MTCPFFLIVPPSRGVLRTHDLNSPNLSTRARLFLCLTAISTCPRSIDPEGFDPNQALNSLAGRASTILSPNRPATALPVMTSDNKQEEKASISQVDDGNGQAARSKYSGGILSSLRGRKANNNKPGLDSDQKEQQSKWSLGILNDPETMEVPGSILLMSSVSEYNEPLGMAHTPARTSASSLPTPFSPSGRSSFSRSRRPVIPEKKRTADGKIVLEPQPDESPNDPLNWKVWKRDAALLSLGFYCMVGGGMTPILAAGFNNVAEEYGVSVPRVALTTGLYMMGLGVGSVLLSPTAILYGKRPVYLVSAVVYLLTSVWCALAPNFVNLVVARVFQGIAVSAVECLPSATVAEIYFLHEKAYRLGIYTLLLLGGKNLVPLVSAVIIQAMGWRWVFWVVAIIVGFCFGLLFLFVPETFWDRTPRPHKHTKHHHRLTSHLHLPRKTPATSHSEARDKMDGVKAVDEMAAGGPSEKGGPIATTRKHKHAHFNDADENVDGHGNHGDDDLSQVKPAAAPSSNLRVDIQAAAAGPLPAIATSNTTATEHSHPGVSLGPATGPLDGSDAERNNGMFDPKSPNGYTEFYRNQEEKTFVQQLKPWSGRLTKDRWIRVAFRPFVLFAYPSILWSTLVYSLSIGWLIVLSESVAHIYMNSESYNFNSLQTGLVYISPFIGGVLGTAVAGKVSDVVVRYLSRKNGGVYEPEFRLVMAIPVAITTTIGLMGFGWSAHEHDRWIVPTFFFGLISFGCSLGSTTAITFAVDSYRQYAGEALVTLNFSKNIFHGLVFSLFFNSWLEHDGSKTVFVAIGAIHMACMLTTIPMYIYGKQARMWTVRKNFMEKF